MILILSALSVKKKTFACLGGMCGVGMCNVLCLLIAEVSGEISMLKWRITEPEVLLGEDETPRRSKVRY